MAAHPALREEFNKGFEMGFLACSVFDLAWFQGANSENWGGDLNSQRNLRKV